MCENSIIKSYICQLEDRPTPQHLGRYLDTQQHSRCTFQCEITVSEGDFSYFTKLSIIHKQSFNDRSTGETFKGRLGGISAHRHINQLLCGRDLGE